MPELVDALIGRPVVGGRRLPIIEKTVSDDRGTLFDAAVNSNRGRHWKIRSPDLAAQGNSLPDLLITMGSRRWLASRSFDLGHAPEPPTYSDQQHRQKRARPTDSRTPRRTHIPSAFSRDAPSVCGFNVRGPLNGIGATSVTAKAALCQKGGK